MEWGAPPPPPPPHTHTLPHTPKEGEKREQKKLTFPPKKRVYLDLAMLTHSICSVPIAHQLYGNFGF
jgi:hypothetical protein